MQYVNLQSKSADFVANCKLSPMVTFAQDDKIVLEFTGDASFRLCLSKSEAMFMIAKISNAASCN